MSGGSDCSAKFVKRGVVRVRGQVRGPYKTRTSAQRSAITYTVFAAIALSETKATKATPCSAMLDMDTSDTTASTSPGYKADDRSHGPCCTSFMISDILHSSLRSPRQRSAEDCNSEPDDDATSVDEERNHAAVPNGAASDTESAADGEREDDGRDSTGKNGDDTRNEDCCGASPKSSTAGSPGKLATKSL